MDCYARSYRTPNSGMVAPVVQLVLIIAAGYATAHPPPFVGDTVIQTQKYSPSKDYVNDWKWWPDFKTGKCETIPYNIDRFVSQIQQLPTSMAD